MKPGPGIIPKFHGPFRSFRIGLNTNREKGTQDNFVVYSQGSRHSVQKYLWLKFLWDELTKEEWKLFLAMPETLKSEIKYSALRAVLLIGKKEIRNRLINCPFLDDQDRPYRNRYQGIKGLEVEIHNESRKLPKVPKFSGWIKSSSAVGRKSSKKSPVFTEPLGIIENDYETIVFDWYYYLTVGELSSTSVGMIESP
jgi:hypothetical protein